MDRTILHIDMDAFFAAIEQLDEPSLRGRPVLVGYDGPRGVVATASYEARPFGCRSAMPMAVAKRLCPHAVIVPVRGQRYREISKRLFDLFDTVSPLVQPISIDEAFIDATGCERLLGDGVAIARRLKQRIRDELHLTASIGVAFNKFLAKLGSDMHKPDGLTVIDRSNVDAMLPPLPIERLWGVGPATAKRLTERGIRTFGDLRRLPAESLLSMFGAEADRWATLARGEDDRPVTPDAQARSIGHEQTFDVDLADPAAVRHVMLEQAEQVGRRLRKHALLARTVTVKIRFGDFQTITRSQTLDAPSDVTQRLWLTARGLFDEWAARSFSPVRLIGVSASQLTTTAGQLALFPDHDADRQHRLDRATDAIVERFGKRSIRRGGV